MGVGEALPDNHPILTRLVRHAACLHSRYHMGQDRRTPWKWVAGRRAGTAVAESGDNAMCMTRAPNRDRQWPFGMRLGLATRTRESYLGAPKGVARAWTVKRIAEQERWTAADITAMRGATH